MSRCASVSASVRSLTPTHSMSAPALVRGAEDVAADAAEAVDPDAYGHAWSPFSLAFSRSRRAGLSARVRRRVGRWSTSRCCDLDEVVAAPRKCAARCSAITTERWRPPVQPIADDEVRLALGHVLRAAGSRAAASALVELLEPPVARRRTRRRAGRSPVSGAQLRLVVRVGQEADVEGQVGVARRAVLEAEGGEGDGEPAGARRARASRRRPCAAASRRSARWCRSRRRRARGSARAARARARMPSTTLPLRRERVAPARLLVAVEQRLLVGLEEQRRGAATPVASQLVDHPGERRRSSSPPRASRHDGGALDLRALVHEQLGERADHLRAAGCRRRSSRRPRTRSSPDDLPAPERPEMIDESSRCDGAHRCGSCADTLSARLVAGARRARGRPSAAGRARASSSSRVAASTASGEPKCSSSARLRAGPMPGRSSRIDSRHRLVAADPVVGDREAVRLVAHALEQLQLGRVVRRARSASRAPGTKTSSIRLASETTATPRSRKPRSGSSPADELALAAVDHDQVRAAREATRRGRRRRASARVWRLALRVRGGRGPRPSSAKSSPRLDARGCVKRR